MSYFIGQDVRVAAAKDAMLLGLKGRVVLESMHTVTIMTSDSRKVMMQKLGSAFELSGGKILIGDDVEGRLEDRIAVASRPARKGARSR